MIVYRYFNEIILLFMATKCFYNNLKIVNVSNLVNNLLHHSYTSMFLVIIHKSYMYNHPLNERYSKIINQIICQMMTET